jgi:2-oxoglutarate ferredoxin oxidoreductase subunit delta
MAKMWRKPFEAEEIKIKPPKISINKDRCKGCGYCTEFCPRDALIMGQEINAKGYISATIADENKCLGCGLCEIICPEFAIKLFGIDNE